LKNILESLCVVPRQAVPIPGDPAMAASCQ